MYPHAYPVSDSELKALKELIRNKGDCYMARITCVNKSAYQYRCSKNIEEFCKNNMANRNELYNHAIEVFIDLFGEAALFEELL